MFEMIIFILKWKYSNNTWPRHDVVSTAVFVETFCSNPILFLHKKLVQYCFSSYFIKSLKVFASSIQWNEKNRVVV